MSNPWSQAYEDLRKPYLEGKMAKKDYDGDGKIESGTDEYMGSKDKAIKKAMGKKVAKEHHQKDADGKVIEHEDTTPSSVEENVDEMITLTKGDYASRNVAGSAYSNAAKKKFDSKIYKAGGGLGSNFLPLANSHEPEGDVIDEKMEKDVKSMRYGDGEKEQAARLKKLAKKRGMPMSKMKDHPQFKKEEKEPPRMQKGAMAYDGPNKARSLAADRVLAKTKAKRDKMVKKESFSDWRSEFVWEDGDSVKKI